MFVGTVRVNRRVGSLPGLKVAEESLNDPEGLFGGPMPAALPPGQRTLVYPEFPCHLPLR